MKGVNSCEHREGFVGQKNYQDRTKENGEYLPASSCKQVLMSVKAERNMGQRVYKRLAILFDLSYILWDY